MRRRIALLLAATLVMSVLGAVSAVAQEGGTYLALGDSVAAGTQQPEPFTPNGYTDKLFKKLKSDHNFDTFVNLACPGDDTIEMISGIGGESEFGSLCYGPFAVLPPGGSSQLDVAVDYLLANPGEVELITLTMGANDILACDPADPDVELCLVEQLTQIAENLPIIVGTLQAVAPGVPIVAMNYYNPNLAFWIIDPQLAEDALALTEPFNGTLEAVYGAFGVPVADVETTFRTYKTGGNQVPQNVRAVCQLTLMCEKAGNQLILSDYDPVEPGDQTDIHPSDLGYKKIAGTFYQLMVDLGLLG